MNNERTVHIGRSDDRNWVPRKTYDMIIEKLDAAVAENNELRARLRKCVSDSYAVQ